MVVYCKIKEDFEQKMSSKYDNILKKDPDLDPYGSYWAVFDGLETGNFKVWVENSYGDCLLKCTKEQFKDLFDFDPVKELA